MRRTAIPSLCLKIKNETKASPHPLEFLSQNQKRDKMHRTAIPSLCLKIKNETKCVAPPFGVFVSKSKTRQNTNKPANKNKKRLSDKNPRALKNQLKAIIL